VNSYFGLGAHREAAAKLARDYQALRQLAEAPFNNCGTEKDDIVSERNPTQPRMLPRQRKRNEREGNEKVEEFCKDKAQGVKRGNPRLSA
jgi:hypothetical protein